MSRPVPGVEDPVVILALVVGLASSAWLALTAYDHQMAPALPGLWATASFGLGVLAVGWVLTALSPRFTASLAASLFPGAVYGSIALSSDGLPQLAYAWSAVPVALAWVGITAGFSDRRGSRGRPWSVRRSSAPRIPRARLSAASGRRR